MPARSKKAVRPYEAQMNQEVTTPPTPAEVILDTSKDTDGEIEIKVRLNSAAPRWEDNYTLQSYYIHKDLLKIFQKQAKKMGKGAKTLLINEGLKYVLVDKPKADKEQKELQRLMEEGTQPN